MPRSISETLEGRVYFATVPPSAEETYVLELINRARANPAIEALRYAINLNEGVTSGQITTTAKQPLAFNGNLLSSSYLHSLYLQPTGQVSLVGQNGTLPQDRMIAAGYVFTTNSSYAESVQELQAAGSTPPKQAQIDALHASLFTDVMSNTRQDRIYMLTDQYKEIGTALTSGPFGGGNGPNNQGPPGIIEVIDYAVSLGNSGGDAFLCGVAYDDSNANQFYDIGEGLGNVTITARRLSDNAIFTTTTYGALNYPDTAGGASGAYTLRLQPGIYDVTGTGGQLGNVQVQYPAVVIGSRNVKRDFTPQQQTSPPSPPPSGGTPLPGVPNPITLKGDLRGKVFIDRDGDGERDDEVDNVRKAGIRVYADLNKNNNWDSNEPFGRVLSNGVWNMTGLSTGIYRITVEPPSGYRISNPAKGFRDVTVVAGRLKQVKTFLVTQRTVISGTVFRDTDGDGVFDTNEKGRPNWRVYLDLNNDGVWQKATEPSRKTNSQGQYAFRDLLAGSYSVRIIPKVGYLQTKPASNGFYVVAIPGDGFSVTNRNFGEKLLG